METTSLCPVITDLYRRLEFRFDLIPKNHVNEPSAKGGNHSERTTSGPYSALCLPPGAPGGHDIEQVDLRQTQLST